MSKLTVVHGPVRSGKTTHIREVLLQEEPESVVFDEMSDQSGDYRLIRIALELAKHDVIISSLRIPKFILDSIVAFTDAGHSVEFVDMAQVKRSKRGTLKILAGPVGAGQETWAQVWKQADPINRSVVNSNSVSSGRKGLGIAIEKIRRGLDVCLILNTENDVEVLNFAGEDA